MEFEPSSNRDDSRHSPGETCGIHQPESTSGFQTHQFILVLAINAQRSSLTFQTTRGNPIAREFWPFSRVVIRITVGEPTGLVKQNVERASIVNGGRWSDSASPYHRGSFPQFRPIGVHVPIFGQRNFVETFADGHRKSKPHQATAIGREPNLQYPCGWLLCIMRVSMERSRKALNGEGALLDRVFQSNYDICEDCQGKSLPAVLLRAGFVRVIVER
ncbi:hypothetical protein DFH08DRAFT_825640 [Mycena albidolilacea]|uniref:Uncharacterized protein n=1 Tax=Mycena albidolilacea TaxID=1033008 RepID=A0AAD6Z1Z7_9AGAR|nr:hypothetical protein DFH08DRAFT_825640 [Mycena albidolilacea]